MVLNEFSLQLIFLGTINFINTIDNEWKKKYRELNTF